MDILLGIIIVLALLAARARRKDDRETENPWNQPWGRRLWSKRLWKDDIRSMRDTTWE